MYHVRDALAPCSIVRAVQTTSPCSLMKQISHLGSRQYPQNRRRRGMLKCQIQSQPTMFRSRFLWEKHLGSWKLTGTCPSPPPSLLRSRPLRHVPSIHYSVPPYTLYVVGFGGRMSEYMTKTSSPRGKFSQISLLPSSEVVKLRQLSLRSPILL